MAARDPVRALLGRVVAFAAGISPDEGEQAVAIAEDVREKVAAGAEVVRRLRGRAPRAAKLTPRAARGAGRELPRGEVVDAEIVEDAPQRTALPAVVVVVDQVAAPSSVPARRSRYD